MVRVFYPRCRVAIQVLMEDFEGGASSEVLRFEVVPRMVEVVRNDHRTADQVRIELDYRDCPIDPRTVRSMLVGVGMADTKSPLVDVRLDDPDSLAFVGYIDVPECALTGEGETVKLEGRDYTALFLDYPWRDGAVDIAQPLERVLAAILAIVPGAADIPVSWLASAQSLDLSTIVGRTQWTPRAGDDAWTLLVDLLGVAGLLPTIVRDTLEIRSATDFGARLVSFTYGSNLSRLSFKRNQNEMRTRQVRVTCWNEAQRAASEAIYPSEPVVVRKRLTASGQVKTEAAPLITYTVSGAYTQAQLDDVARGIYEEAAREQVEGAMETRDLVDLDGAILPILGNGDALHVQLGKTGDQSSIQGMSETEALAFLTSGPRAMQAEVAAVLVASWTRAQSLAATFYLRRVTHRWSRSDGYAMTAEFINYVLGSE